MKKIEGNVQRKWFKKKGEGRGRKNEEKGTNEKKMKTDIMKKRTGSKGF